LKLLKELYLGNARKRREMFAYLGTKMAATYIRNRYKPLYHLPAFPTLGDFYMSCRVGLAMQIYNVLFFLQYVSGINFIYISLPLKSRHIYFYIAS